MQSRTIKIAELLSLASLAAASTLALPLVERLVATAWQSYKFAGTANDGYISLSFKAALLFSMLLAGTFLAALSAHIHAECNQAIRASAWSRWAMFIVVVVAAFYWLLSNGALNNWR